MLAKLCADVLHYEINCHMIVSFVPWMDDRTDGWMESFISSRHPLLYITSVCPVHNAQVCYFNNVRFMFLVFKKNFYLFK